jgi:hypothetical protein
LSPAFVAGVVYFLASTALLWWLARMILGSGGRVRGGGAGRKMGMLIFLPLKLTVMLGGLYFFLVRMELSPEEFTIGAGSSLVVFTATVATFWWVGRAKNS